MSHFVYDDTDLNYPKTNLSPLPPGADPTQWVAAIDWNTSCQAVVDIKAFLQGAKWYGLDDQATDPAPTGIDDYIWLDTSGDLWLHTGGPGGSDDQLNVGAAGEVNTASNVNTVGVGVYKQKVVYDLEFKGINAGSSKISVTNVPGTNTIDIDLVEAQVTHDNLGGSGTNSHSEIDTHIGLFESKTQGSVWYSDAITAAALAPGNAGEFLKTQGVANPVWSNPIIVQDEGTPIGSTPHTTLNFIGAAVIASDGGSGVANVSITGAIGTGTDHSIARYDGTTTVQDSEWFIDDAGTASVTQTAADTSAALSINRSPSSGPVAANAINVTLGSNATGDAVYVHTYGSSGHGISVVEERGSTSGYSCLKTYQAGTGVDTYGILLGESAQAREVPMMLLTRDPAVVHTDAHGIRVDHPGVGPSAGIYVYRYPGSSADAQGVAVLMNQNCNGAGVDINYSGSHTALAIWLQTGTTGEAIMVLEEDTVAGRSVPMVFLQRQSNSTGPVLEIDNNATGNCYSVSVNHVGTYPGIYLVNTGDSSGINVVQQGGSVGKAAVEVYLATGLTQNALRVDEENTGGGGRSAQMVLLTRQSNSTGHVLAIDNGAAATARSIDITHVGTAYGVYITHSGESGNAALGINRCPSNPCAALGIALTMGTNCTAEGINVNNDGSGSGVFVGQGGADQAFRAYLNGTVVGGAAGQQAFKAHETAEARTAPMCELIRDAAVVHADGHGLKITHPGVGTSSALFIDRNPGSSIAAMGIHVALGSNATGTVVNAVVNGGGGAAFKMSDATSTKAFFEADKGDSSVNAPANTGRLIYDTAANHWKISENTGNYFQLGTVGAGGSVSLDSAYDGGHTITVDDGAVTLNANSADTTAALSITRSPTSSAGAKGIDITMGANTTSTGAAIKCDLTAGCAAPGLLIYNYGSGTGIVVGLDTALDNSAMTLYDADDVDIRTANMVNLNRGAAATGHVLSIDNNATATSDSINIDHEGTGAGIYLDHAGASDALVVNKNTGNGDAIEVTQNSIGNGLNIQLLKEDASVGGIWVYDGSDYDRQYAMVNLEREAAATGHALLINNDATASSCSIYIDHEGTASAIDINQAGDGHGINIFLSGGNNKAAYACYLATATDNYALNLSEDTAIRTTPLAFLHRNTNSTGAVLLIDNDATATSKSIQVDHEGTGDAVYVDNAGTGVGVHVIQTGGTPACAFKAWLQTATTQYGLLIQEENTVAGRSVPMVLLERESNSTGHVLNILNEADDTACSIYANHDGTATGFFIDYGPPAGGTAAGMEIQQTGLATGSYGLRLSENNAAIRTASMLSITRDAVSDGHGIAITHPGAETGTTKAGLYINRSPGSSVPAQGIQLLMGANATSYGILLDNYGTGCGVMVVQHGNAWGYGVDVRGTQGGITVYEDSTGRAVQLVAISRTANSTGHCVTIDNQASITARAIDITHVGTADGVYIGHSGDSSAAAIAIARTPGTTQPANGVWLSMGANASGDGLYITHVGSGHGVKVIADQASGSDKFAFDAFLAGAAASQGGLRVTENTDANRSGAMIFLARSNTNATGHVLFINNDATATSHSIDIDHAGSADAVYIGITGSGDALDVLLSTATDNRAIAIGETDVARTTPMIVASRQASASGTMLQLTNYGTGYSEYIQHAGTGIALQISLEGDTTTGSCAALFKDNDSCARTANLVTIGRSANATGHALYINNDATATSRSIFVDHEGTGEAIYVDQAGAGYGLHINQTGNASAVRVVNSGAGAAYSAYLAGTEATTQGLVITESDNARTWDMISLSRAASATGNVITIDNNATATSRSISIDHESSGNAIDIDYAGNADALNINLDGSTGKEAAQALVITETALARTEPLVSITRSAATANQAALTVNNAGLNNTISIGHSGSGSSQSGIWIYLSGADSTNPHGLSITETDVDHQGPMIYLAREANATGNVLSINNDSTGSNRSIYIDHESNGPAIQANYAGNDDALSLHLDGSTGKETAQALVITETALNRNTPAVEITRTSTIANANAHGIKITHPGVSDAAAIYIDRSPASGATGIGIEMVLSANANKGIVINNDALSNGIEILQGGQADAIFVELDNNAVAQAFYARDAIAGGVSRSTAMIEVLRHADVANSGGHGLKITHPGEGTASAIYIDRSPASEAGGVGMTLVHGANTTGYCTYISNSSTKTAAKSLMIEHSGPAHVLHIDNTNTASSSHSIVIEHDGDAAALKITANGTSASSNAIEISRNPSSLIQARGMYMAMTNNCQMEGIYLFNEGRHHGIHVKQAADSASGYAGFAVEVSGDSTFIQGIYAEDASDTTTVSANPLVEILRRNYANAPALSVKSTSGTSGAGTGDDTVYIEHAVGTNAAAAAGLHVHLTETDGGQYGIYVTEDSVTARAGALLYIDRGYASSTGDVLIIKSNATSTSRGINVTHKSDYDAVYVHHQGSAFGFHAYMNSASAAQQGLSITEDDSATRTGGMIDLVRSSPSTGPMIELTLGTSTAAIYTTDADLTFRPYQGKGVDISCAATSSGTPSALLKVAPPAYTGMTASTEVNLINFDLGAQTITWATGALTTERVFWIQEPTLAFAAASTVTTAATVAIEGPPQPGANCTITNPYALLIESGNLHLASGQAGVAPDALTSSTSITPDANDSNIFTLSLAHNTTMNAISNAKAGYTYNFLITNTGSYTITWAAGYLFPGGTDHTMTASGKDLISCIYDGTSFWCCFSQAFA